MSTTEANIKIARHNGIVTSISVFMPIWSKTSDHGKLLIQLPLLGIDTIAKDEADSEIAIKEAIQSFCIVAEKFGQGIEIELQALGWIAVDGESGEPLLGYNVEETDELLERLFHTGENYVNPHLEIVA
ncbi:hypothetical protein FRZ67_15105 [Panacibacter ginsenosidivorans]|uniref:Uncharacterized protein n=1 Tax=Panacibacter ginsenosidivorans TaxID=1813871 RepID=A0A5B8VAQ2_9BACT|nr:hypothetical protein [Panacibacter ginsenosidivorans]QEC68570.1 hypothetical protein FRZ67_15105 [Panacibacter ginsenosidivorans]